MNKKIGLIVLGLVLFSLVINCVSAYGYLDLRQGSEQVINWVVDFSEPFLSVTLGGQTGGYTGYLLFEKFLLFVLILSLVYISLKNIEAVKSNPGVHWIIAIVIPMMAVRYIDMDWLAAIYLQYTAFGIIVTSILPFVLFFFLIETVDKGVVRKVGWIAFLVLYYGLWSTATNTTYAGFYFWVIVLAVLFLIFDGTIYRYLLMEKMKAAGSNDVLEHIGNLGKKLNEVEGLAGLTDPQKEELREMYLKKIKQYRKQL